MIKFLKERIKIIYKYIYVIIFFTLAVGVGTFYYVSNIPGYYESKSILLVSSTNENDINNFIIHLKSNDLIGEVKELSKVSYSVEELKNMIIEVRKNYDLILIEYPPISLITDAVNVSEILDGDANIIEYNRKNRAAIQGSGDQLNDVNTFVLGGIITMVNINKQKKLYRE